MPTYAVQLHPRLPVVLASVTPEFTFQNDFLHYRADVAHLLDSLSEPVFYMMDMRNLNFDFGEITSATNLAARIDNPNFHHPNVGQVIFVTTDPTWVGIADGMNSDTYGNLSIPVFETVEDALDYVEAQLR